MPQLTEQKIIELMREEYESKLSKLDDALKSFMKVDDGGDDGDKKGVIGVDTKVRHKGSQLLYTVHEVAPQEIVLRTPEGDLFPVSDDEFEAEYELD